MDQTANNDAAQQLQQLVAEYAGAELRADTALMERLLTDDFVGIGPRGFMLSKAEWLQRQTSGDLKHEAFQLDDTHVRLYGAAAVVTGRETETGTYRDQPIGGDYRTTLIFVQQQGRWLLAGIHLSPIAGPPPPRQS